MHKAPQQPLWLPGHRHVSVAQDCCQLPHAFGNRAQLLLGLLQAGTCRSLAVWWPPYTNSWERLSWPEGSVAPLCAGKSLHGWVMPAGCGPVLWGPSTARSQPAHRDGSAGCLAFQSRLTPEPSSPFTGRELLFPRSIWLSPEPVPFWPWHIFPLYSRGYRVLCCLEIKLDETGTSF